MKLVIQVAQRDDAKAWALLQRHSPGVALPNRTLVISQQAAAELRRAGIQFVVFFRKLKQELKQQLQQEEILIVEKDADVL